VETFFKVLFQWLLVDDIADVSAIAPFESNTLEEGIVGKSRNLNFWKVIV
jgi:hypothetical protein